MKKAEMKVKIKKIMSNKRFKLVGIVVLSAIVLIIVIRLFLLVIPVSGYEIEGQTYYEKEEIINAANVRMGTPIFGINSAEVEDNILKNCPHIKSVKLRQNLSGVLCFIVEERVPGWYVQVHNAFYVLDYDMRVILETYDEESLKKRGITKLILPELQSAVIGELPSFGNGDELLIGETLKIIDTIRTHDIKKIMTSIDLYNRFDIRFTVSETYDVVFGDMKKAEEKFQRVLSRVEENKKSGGYGGEINVINPKAVSFKPYFDETPPLAESDATETPKED